MGLPPASLKQQRWQSSPAHAARRWWPPVFQDLTALAGAATKQPVQQGQ